MTNPGSERAKRSSLLTLRAHLIISSSISALAFAAVMAVSVFVPLGMQLANMDADDPAALGMAEHFMFLHSALWPLIAWSLIASITSATCLYHKMRRPLIRFAACYAALEKGEIPREITIRITDYLNGEISLLGATQEGG